MNTGTENISLRELLAAYIETLRPQVHPVMTNHVTKTLEAYEAALQVKVPRDREEVPKEMRPLFMLFAGTVDSRLTIQTPLSGVLEAGLLFSTLKESSERGYGIIDKLRSCGKQANALLETHLDILEDLLQIFLGGAHPSVTMDEVRATGLHPGELPPDFDIFDHM